MSFFTGEGLSAGFDRTIELDRLQRKCAHGIHEVLYSFFHVIVHSCILASCIHVFMYSCIHLFMCSKINAYVFTYSCVFCSCIHEFMFSCIHVTM